MVRFHLCLCNFPMKSHRSSVPKRQAHCFLKSVLERHSASGGSNAEFSTSRKTTSPASLFSAKGKTLAPSMKRMELKAQAPSADCTPVGKIAAADYLTTALSKSPCLFIHTGAPQLSPVTLFRTVAHQAPLTMGFSRQEYWSGLPFPTPGDLPHPGVEPAALTSLALAGWFFTAEPFGKPLCLYTRC